MKTLSKCADGYPTKKGGNRGKGFNSLFKSRDEAGMSSSIKEFVC